MKISSRLDYFLAKIAGREVSLSDIKPPIPASMTETLLNEIAGKMGTASSAATQTADGLMSKNDKKKLDGITDAAANKAGLVKQAANVAYAAGDAPTAAEFKALIDALIASGAMAAPSNP